MVNSYPTALQGATKKAAIQICGMASERKNFHVLLLNFEKLTKLSFDPLYSLATSWFGSTSLISIFSDLFIV